MTLVAEVESAALQLDPEFRARLAVTLIESLDESLERDAARIERLWADEAEARLRRIERGEVEPIPAGFVFRRLRNRGA